MPGLWSKEVQEPSKSSCRIGSSLEKESPRNENNPISPVSRPAVRRLSSAMASLDELSLGPSVVVPPRHMHTPSNAHETAAALEMAKHRLSVSGDGTSTPSTPPETSTTDSYAFAFDIDGVLIRGGRPIPEAIEAMKVLNGQNEYGVKV